jgi:membrane-associated protease RseP (regulator of RpoE activity)
LVLDLARFERAVGTPVGGILGLDVLDGLAVSIDYPGRRVRVAASGSLAIEGAARIPIERRENLIGIALETKGGPLPVLLDTGMTGTLAVEEGEAKRRGVEADPTRSPEWRVGIGGGKASPVAKIPWAQLGGRWIPSLEVVLEKPAGGFAGAVGTGLLRFFEVVIDLGTNTVQLGCEPSELADPAPTNPSGMRIDTRFDFPAEGWRVDAVRAGSPAAKAGILAGDVVVEIGGESVRRADWRRMRDALAMASGELRVRTLGPEGPVERVLRR